KLVLGLVDPFELLHEVAVHGPDQGDGPAEAPGAEPEEVQRQRPQGHAIFRGVRGRWRSRVCGFGQGGFPIWTVCVPERRDGGFTMFSSPSRTRASTPRFTPSAVSPV